MRKKGKSQAEVYSLRKVSSNTSLRKVSSPTHTKVCVGDDMLRTMSKEKSL